MQFKELKIKKEIIDALENENYIELTPIQEMAIPIVLENKDLIAQAPTGTGKTFAYGIPLINMINKEEKNVQALVICPTRELAVQVCNELRKLLVNIEGVKAQVLYGGQNIEFQIKDLKKHPQIIVGTPGRIRDHLSRKTLNFTNLKYLVLDEADEMLDMGFKEELDEILTNVNHDHQTLLFSATMPESIKKIAETYLNNPLMIKTFYEKKELPKVSQYYVKLLEKNKVDCLCRMLNAYNFKQALVFCKTKKNVDELGTILIDRGYKIECLHGDLRQEARDKVMKMFKQGMIRVLIATDIAARGLDISGIDVVFNYDIPDDVEYYVHRIGRTARAGREGTAYTFVNRKQLKIIKEYEKKLKTTISRIDPPTYEESKLARIHHLLDEIIAEENFNNINEYKKYVDDFIAEKEQKYSINDISALLLKHVIDGDAKTSDDGTDIRVLEEVSKEHKRNKTPDNFVRIFINLGLVDNLNKNLLKSLVTEKRHVNKDEIINIDILSTFSFFEIPLKQAPIVMKNLNGKFFNDREITVEIAGSRDKKNNESKKRSKRDKDKKNNESKKRSKSDKDRKNNKIKFDSKKNKPKRKQRIDIKW